MVRTASPAAPDRVDDAVLDDLRSRLLAFRPVPGLGRGWELGADAAVVADLVRHWTDGYDWRQAEERIRALPWVRSRGGVRAVHQRAEDDAAPVVVLLHGWPDSVLRYERVLPLLTDLHVVVPALPGYPFSDLRGTARAAMAEPIAALMHELGYDRYVVSGGDIGSGVGEALGRLVPGEVAALHLTDVPWRRALDPPDDQTDAERAFTERARDWFQAEGAYSHEQSTKPDTLSVALGDSPAGLLAWIVEKLRSWSDCDGDVERAFPRDDLLTWVTAYWVTGAIGTSFGPYALREPPQQGRVTPPLAATLFPRDLLVAPREFAERTFDVRVWQTPEHGGHFGAWEQPRLFADGVRAALALG